MLSSNGEDCTLDIDCNSGYCLNNFCNGNKSDGSYCGIGADCSSFECNNNVCGEIDSNSESPDLFENG